MVDYARLADSAKGKQDADRTEIERHKRLRLDKCGFFEKLKNHLYGEMNKANVELHKRKTATFDKYVLPGFTEEIFLTYGTNLLCKVGIGVMNGRCCITAVINGPPNGNEISRKEYLCNQDESCTEILTAPGKEVPTFGDHPEAIAVDIISGILVGHFN